MSGGCKNIDILRSQFVLKYDSWDPNTDIKGEDIDSARVASGVSAADLMINTLVWGWIYNWDENVKLMAYFDIVQPEKVTDKAQAPISQETPRSGPISATT